MPEPYAQNTNTAPTAQYPTQEYYTQHNDAAERQAASATGWTSQTVRPNARHSTTRGWMFELGSSRRAINPEQYRTTTLSTDFSSGPASSPSLAPKRRLENSYQSIPLGTHATATTSVAPSVLPYTGTVTNAAPSVLPYTGTQQLNTAPTQPLGVVTAPVPRTPDMFGPMPPRSATDSAPKVALSPGMTKRRADPGTNYQLIPTSNSVQLRNSNPTLSATPNMTPVTPSVVPYQSTPLQSNNVTPVTPSVVSYQSTPFHNSATSNVTPVNSNPAPTLAANPKRAPVVYSTSK